MKKKKISKKKKKTKAATSARTKPAKAKRAQTTQKKTKPGKVTDSRTVVTAKVLEIFRTVYGGDESDADILKIDPNGFDVDPAPFYEMLEGEFGSSILDDKNPSFAGLGGTVAQAIDAIASRWKASDADDDTVGLAEGPYPALDFYLGNVRRTSKKPTDGDLKQELTMFKYALRDDYKALKEEAKRALAQQHVEQVIDIARNNKLSLDAARAEQVLRLILAS